MLIKRLPSKPCNIVSCIGKIYQKFVFFLQQVDCVSHNLVKNGTIFQRRFLLKFLNTFVKQAQLVFIFTIEEMY